MNDADNKAIKKKAETLLARIQQPIQIQPVCELYSRSQYWLSHSP
jgi:hypothetical protein